MLCGFNLPTLSIRFEVVFALSDPEIGEDVARESELAIRECLSDVAREQLPHSVVKQGFLVTATTALTGFVEKVGSVEKVGYLVRSACVSAALSRTFVFALKKSAGKMTLCTKPLSPLPP